MPGNQGGRGRRLLTELSSRVTPRVVLGVLGGLALLVSGFFGGLAAVPDGGLPTVGPAEKVDGLPWAVTVDDVVLTPELPPALLSDDDNHFLVVVAVVEATAGESRADLDDILRVEGVTGVDPHAEPDAVVVIRDATLAQSVHPGLPERLAFFWERGGADDVPAEATVVVYGKTHRESSLTGTMEWLDREPRARVTAPVRDRRDADGG